MRRVSIFLIPLLFVAMVRAADPTKTLATIQTFAFGGIGVTGATSEGELAFREILKHPSPEKDFLALLKSDNPQAKCYALVGLHGLHPDNYSSYAAPFAQDKTLVSIAGGCCIMSEPLSDVVARIGKGQYDHYLKK